MKGFSSSNKRIKEARKKIRKFLPDHEILEVAKAGMKAAAETAEKTKEIATKCYVLDMKKKLYSITIPTLPKKEALVLSPDEVIMPILEQAGCQMADDGVQPLLFVIVAMGRNLKVPMEVFKKDPMKYCGIVVDVATVDGRAMQGFMRASFSVKYQMQSSGISLIDSYEVERVERGSTRYKTFDAFNDLDRSPYAQKFFNGYQIVFRDNMLKELLKDV